MAADIRIARKGAGKLGLPEVSLGVLPGTGGTQRLVRIVGKSKAIELMATGQLFDFERGMELGIVNQVFEAETLNEFAQMVHDYAASSRRQTRRRTRLVESNAPCKLAPRFLLNLLSRSNANCSSNSSNPKTRKKVLTLT